MTCSTKIRRRKATTITDMYTEVDLGQRTVQATEDRRWLDYRRNKKHKSRWNITISHNTSTIRFTHTLFLPSLMDFPHIFAVVVAAQHMIELSFPYLSLCLLLVPEVLCINFQAFIFCGFAN